MIYICTLSFIMNLVYYFKNYKGSYKLSCFFIIKTLALIIFFNIIFSYFKIMFNIKNFNMEFLIMIYCISLILYCFSKKYGCITYSTLISYLILLDSRTDIFIQGLFMISILHIFEGVFVIVNYIFNEIDKSSKIYTPILIDSIPLIFVVFYRRSSFREYNKLFGICSGVVILIYGLISISFIYIYGNVLFEIISLIILACIHKNLHLVDKSVFKYISKNNIV